MNSTGCLLSHEGAFLEPDKIPEAFRDGIVRHGGSTHAAGELFLNWPNTRLIRTGFTQDTKERIHASHRNTDLFHGDRHVCFFPPGTIHCISRASTIQKNHALIRSLLYLWVSDGYGFGFAVDWAEEADRSGARNVSGVKSGGTDA